MVNYKALEGHRYEIKPNPDRENCKNTRIYVSLIDSAFKVLEHLFLGLQIR